MLRVQVFKTFLNEILNRVSLTYNWSPFFSFIFDLIEIYFFGALNVVTYFEIRTVFSFIFSIVIPTMNTKNNFNLFLNLFKKFKSPILTRSQALIFSDKLNFHILYQAHTLEYLRQCHLPFVWYPQTRKKAKIGMTITSCIKNQGPFFKSFTACWKSVIQWLTSCYN